jgi:hypothetical protein
MKTARLATAAVCSAVLALASTAASTEDKGAPKFEVKKLLENDKVSVVEYHYQPGAENASVPTTARVVRALTDGALERRYPDGKKETIEWKAGQVRFNDAPAGGAKQYTVKNVGKKDMALYLVILK